MDLEYDESANVLFWTGRGEIPFGNTLNKMQLDESGIPSAKHHSNVIHEIMAQNFDEAIGLKLDPTGKRIYVADVGGTVWMCNLDGSHRVKVYENKSCAFTCLTLS
jgi:sugar lactone lactonase YvrE